MLRLSGSTRSRRLRGPRSPPNRTNRGGALRKTFSSPSWVRAVSRPVFRSRTWSRSHARRQAGAVREEAGCVLFLGLGQAAELSPRAADKSRLPRTRSRASPLGDQANSSRSMPVRLSLFPGRRPAARGPVPRPDPEVGEVLASGDQAGSSGRRPFASGANRVSSERQQARAAAWRRRMARESIPACNLFRGRPVGWLRRRRDQS